MRIHWLIVAAVALSTAQAHADDSPNLPKRKPGLWEIVRTSDRNSDQSHTVHSRCLPTSAIRWARTSAANVTCRIRAVR